MPTPPQLISYVHSLERRLKMEPSTRELFSGPPIIISKKASSSTALSPSEICTIARLYIPMI